ncbi:thioesterase [Pandoraea capi]|nr:thioesterase [Pandoraea sp. LA3]MDN4584428.1 thioesterase [Pandoraea capi]
MPSIYDGPIVDAHQHFWEPQGDRLPWLAPQARLAFRYGNYDAIKRPYLPPDLLADAGHHRIVGTVYVEAEWNPKDPIGETRYIHDIASRYGLPNAVVAQAWLDRDDIDAVLHEQARFALVRSVRHKPGRASTPQDAATQPSLMRSESWRRGYALLNRYGLHFDLQTPWWHLDDAVLLARDFPETLIVLNHAGLPSERSEAGLSAWHAAMGRFAEMPNARVKVSGLGQAGRAWRAQDQAWIVREVIAMFGAPRVMFASNFPVDSLCASYDDIYAGFKSLVASHTPDQQRALFHDTACEVYRIGLPSPLGRPAR